MDIPESMRDKLAAWNNGKGIDIESWVGCEGNFRLACGYASIFWPEFVEHEGYVLRKGFSLDSLRSWEEHCSGNRESIEAVMNHLHIADIQHYGCEDISKDKIVLLGNTLREIYEAKLRWQFPGREFVVSFPEPENEEDLIAFELTFFQKSANNDRAV